MHLENQREKHCSLRTKSNEVGSHFSLVDTNFLRELRSWEAASRFTNYCLQNKIPLASNGLYPPDFIIEYTGVLREKKLPRLPEFCDGTELASWTQSSIEICKKFYSDSLPRLVENAMKNLRRKVDDGRRSGTSRRIFKAAHLGWKRNKRKLREHALNTLTFNAILSFKIKNQERVDMYLQLLVWCLGLWAEG